MINEKDKIVIVPKKISLKLSDLLEQINDENIHKEELSEGPVGKEIW